MKAPAWLRRNPTKAARTIHRVIEGLREIGVLLIAFGPLEAAVSRTSLRDAAAFLRLFLGGGILIFVIALAFEWRWLDER